MIPQLIWQQQILCSPHSSAAFNFTQVIKIWRLLSAFSATCLNHVMLLWCGCGLSAKTKANSLLSARGERNSKPKVTRYSIFFSTRQLEVCWEASALDTCMTLHFTIGCVGRLPVISTGWSVEDTNLTGYLCVPVWPLLMLCFVFWLALCCLSRLRPPNKEYWVLNPAELEFPRRQSVHSALRNNSEKAMWLFFYPACFVL